MYKMRGKRILAAVLSALLLTTGIQIPAAAATEGGRVNYSATPSDAAPELDEDLEVIPDEDEIVILPATPADAVNKPNSIQPMILDITAPKVNSARLLTTETSVPGKLTLELDVVEEGTGVSTVILYGDWGLASASFAQPLFTGTNTIDLELQPGITVGQYEAYALILLDAYNQATYFKYFHDDNYEWPFANDVIFNIISSVPSQADFVLEHISLQNPTLQNGEYLKADIQVGNIGNGIYNIRLGFCYNGDRSDIWNARYRQNLSGEIKQGDNTITLNTSYFSEGSYELVEISLEGADGAVFYHKDDDTQLWPFGDLEITVLGQSDPDPDPVITGARIKNTTIQSPGTIDIEMDIVVGNGGVSQIYLNLTSDDMNSVETMVSLPLAPGDLGEIQTSDQPVIQNGTYTFRFPVPSDMYPGIDYYIYNVAIIDRADYYQEYSSWDSWVYNLPAVCITRPEYALETSVLNPKLPELLAAIPNGSKILLDGGTSDIIPRAVFTALAGKDITVSVERYDSLSGLYGLYTFNGRDISTATIRSVPIKFSFAYAAGADYGIADETVYLLQFEGSGRLPCPITFRITVSSLLHAENSYDSGTMYVSRLSGTSLVWDRIVSESADGLTELSFTNYSDYILSRTKPVYKSSGGGSGFGGSSSSTSAGTWIKDETGWWYRYHNGTYPKTEWKYINGSWYYFEDTGYMATGWKLLDGKWYWLDSGSGKMLAGSWLSDRGNWYYLGGDGAMATGWQNYQNTYYFLSEIPGESYGSMLRNEKTPDGYHVNQDGIWTP